MAGFIFSETKFSARDGKGLVRSTGAKRTPEQPDPKGCALNSEQHNNSQILNQKIAKFVP